MIGDYRPASFGGAPFYVSQTTDAFGRRGAHHEFPYKDRGLWDDLGGKDGQRQLEGYVTDFIDGGFAAARDRLAEALQKGAGELVHPWLGRHQVVCVDYSLSHNEKELGVCRVSMTFIDADTTAGQPQANPVAGVMSGGDSARTALSGLFSNNFSVRGVMAFVAETSFARLDPLLVYVRQGLSVYRQTVAALQPFIDDALNIFGDTRGRNFFLPDYAVDKIDYLDANRLTLPPDELALNILGLTALLIPVAGNAENAYQSISGLWSLAAGAEPYRSPSGAASAVSEAIINRNLAALDFLFMGAAAVETARLVPWISFEYQSQAAEVQTDLLTRFDALAEKVNSFSDGEAEADAFYLAGQTMVAHALEIIGLTAPNLALLGQTTLIDTWPSVRLCYDLYESLDREDDLVSRNQVSHPGFMPGGVALEYLIDKG